MHSNLPLGEAAFNFMVHNMKRAAERRGYVWDLTKEKVREFTSQPCHYCGAEPSAGWTNSIRYNGVYLHNGLDRIDNDRGYVIDNIAPACGTCNIAKQTMTQTEFLVWISRVYAHSVSKEK